MKLTDAEKSYLLAACKLATPGEWKFAWKQAGKELGWSPTRSDAVLVALGNRHPPLIRTASGQYCFIEPEGQVVGQDLIGKGWKPAKR